MRGRRVESITCGSPYHCLLIWTLGALFEGCCWSEKFVRPIKVGVSTQILNRGLDLGVHVGVALMLTTGKENHVPI